ncbi:hypothetical protein QFZ84_004083 [Pseudomonas fluorescens]
MPETFAEARLPPSFLQVNAILPFIRHSLTINLAPIPATSDTHHHA